MIFKLCVLAAFATMASCGQASSSASLQTVPSHGHGPASSHGVYGHVAESHGNYGHEAYPHAHPSYKFAYNVHDPHTHDIKAQEESRDGHHVKGFYSLYEADGSKQVVHYEDNGHGFEAHVHKEGGHHPISAPVHYSSSPAYHAAPKYENYH